MPSKKSNHQPAQPPRRRPRHRTRSEARARALTHQAFWPILSLSFILWILYRWLFTFPVLFDEAIGKAIFFGLPAWLYITVSGFRQVLDSFNQDKIKVGLLRGVAAGGVFGFIGVLLKLAIHGGNFQPAPLFLADRFWYEFLLALLTAFWETLFFYGFVMSVVMHRYHRWPIGKQLILVTLIFLLFHIPNTFLRFDLTVVFSMLLLLTLFSLGQALLFWRQRNAYTLVLSHAIWGMMLLIYF